jgi:hypothetical protein
MSFMRWFRSSTLHLKRIWNVAPLMVMFDIVVAPSLLQTRTSNHGGYIAFYFDVSQTKSNTRDARTDLPYESVKRE